MIIYSIDTVYIEYGYSMYTHTKLEVRRQVEIDK